MFRKFRALASILLLAGCAGQQRGCQNFSAENFGADWVVAQYNASGKPFLCYHLYGTSIANEAQSDGIHWQDRETGGMVHISGWYNRVQIASKNGESEAKRLGVDLNKCDNGVYPADGSQ